jgi:hypothetical protein
VAIVSRQRDCSVKTAIAPTPKRRCGGPVANVRLAAPSKGPSTSPNVVSVGGTSISRNAITGAFQQEIAWQSSGSGPSVYETRPGYQNAISTIVQTRRGTPDVSSDADPSTGVWVYAYPYWYIVGGTSVAAPVWAGIVNSGGRFFTASQSELTNHVSPPLHPCRPVYWALSQSRSPRRLTDFNR